MTSPLENYREIYLPHGDAERVLRRIQSLFDRVGYVTIADVKLLLDAHGSIPTAEDSYTGWRDISRIRIRGSEHNVTLVLPSVIDLRKRDAHSSESDGDRTALIVYVNLDQMPGTFHSKESARNVISAILNERLGHYNPMVSIAPADIQNNLEGTN